MSTRALKILAVNLGLCAAAGNLVAQVVVTNVYSFQGNLNNDGGIPEAGLVQGTNGNFYGTCLTGGTYPYDGTVFVVSPRGVEAPIYTFLGPGADDGLGPEESLVLGRDGNFYGTTPGGGVNSLDDGTIFRVNPVTGIETNLYSFGSYTNDGITPRCALVLGNDGNFYGTTSGGGTNNDGTVFRITPGGVYTNIYSFGGTSADGSEPFAGLVLGSDGNFYGTTALGGSNANFTGIGTIFQISPGGSETVLYSFGSYSPDAIDGYGPQTPLVQGSDGNFYGTTKYGGTNYLSDGTIFRISPDGNYTNLYTFNGYPTDGATPNALVLGSDGNFYGTAEQGGTNYYGTIFRISPCGDYTNLYSFIGPANGYPDEGQTPGAPLLQASDGTFYGTTLYGGIAGGNVFHLTVPLSLPANQISAIQIEGTNVLVTIPSVDGETYQLQDRTSLTAGVWINVAGQVLSSGSLLTVTNFGGFSQPQQFYRFAITP